MRAIPHQIPISIPGLPGGEPTSPSGVWVPKVEIERCGPLPLFSVKVPLFSRPAPILGKEQSLTFVMTPIDLKVSTPLPGCYSLDQIRKFFAVGASHVETGRALDELAAESAAAKTELITKMGEITSVLTKLPATVLSEDVRARVIALVVESSEIVELRREVEKLKAELEAMKTPRKPN